MSSLEKEYDEGKRKKLIHVLRCWRMEDGVDLEKSKKKFVLRKYRKCGDNVKMKRATISPL